MIAHEYFPIAQAVVASLIAGFAVFCGWGIGTFRERRARSAEQEILAQVGRDLPTLLLDYEAEQRKAREYLAKIEEVIGERETWRTLYNDQASGHDNAQALMLQTISALARQYEKKTGERPRIDPIIERVREDWSLQHGPATREKLGQDGRLPEDKQNPHT